MLYYDPATGEPVPLVSRSRSNEMVTLLPPVTLFPEYQLTVGIRAVDKFNAKTQLNRTVVAYPPNIDPDRVYNVDCWTSNYTIREYCALCHADADPLAWDTTEADPLADCADCECVGSYNLTGTEAFTQQLTERELRTARGTNSVSALLVLAKIVSKLNNEAKAVRPRRPPPRPPPPSAAPPPPDLSAAK